MIAGLLRCRKAAADSGEPARSRFPDDFADSFFACVRAVARAASALTATHRLGSTETAPFADIDPS